MESVERFISVVGALEDVIFQKRMRLLQRDKNRRARDRHALLGKRASCPILQLLKATSHLSHELHRHIRILCTLQ